MFIHREKYGQIHGCTVYKADNGIPSAFPSATDAVVTLPQISFPTNTSQSTGDLETPDQTRVNAMTATISVETSKMSNELSGEGMQSYVVKYAQEVIQPNSSEIRMVGFTAYLTGMVTSLPSPSVQVGQSGTSDISINVFKYRLIEGDKELWCVDKLAGIVRIAGKNSREELDNLL